jgi:hypothetical protein
VFRLLLLFSSALIFEYDTTPSTKCLWLHPTHRSIIVNWPPHRSIGNADPYEYKMEYKLLGGIYSGELTKTRSTPTQWTQLMRKSQVAVAFIVDSVEVVALADPSRTIPRFELSSAIGLDLFILALDVGAMLHMIMTEGTLSVDSGIGLETYVRWDVSGGVFVFIIALACVWSQSFQ